ncbi:MAG TPA: hypothetical protein ENJ79_02140 [Gammaproteobacteria bacterium]|nr:hypothetical protein [Gammaproteobacteria bacterium]
MLVSRPVLAVDLPVVLLEHMDDEVLALSIEESELEHGPVWAPGQGNVPLGTDKLIDILNQWALKAYPQYQAIRIREIILKPIESPTYGTHWHYLVAFRGLPRAEGQVRQQEGRLHMVAVLFNGKVIPGVIEPRP